MISRNFLANHALHNARKDLVDISTAAVGLRQQLVQVLSLYADQRMAKVYQLVYPTKCTDEKSLAFMASLEPNFSVFARQLADAQVVASSVQTEVRLNAEKRIVSDMHVYAIIETSHHKGRIKAKSFHDYAAGVVDRLFDSFKQNQTVQTRLLKKTAFEILNKMVGNDSLYRVQDAINVAVRDARVVAQRENLLEKAVESFREKYRVKYTRVLVAFLKNNISPGLLEEDDFQRVWKEFLVEDLMNS
jgi:hypothetical protein